MCFGGVLWCGCHWFSPKRNYKGCVIPQLLAVHSTFSTYFFEARLGSLRCSNFTLQFTISLHDFFVTLLIGSCALSWCSIPHHRVNWKWHQGWPGDLNQETRVAWGPSLREEKSYSWPSINLLFVCHLFAVCAMLPERFGLKKHPDGDLLVF